MLTRVLLNINSLQILTNNPTANKPKKEEPLPPEQTPTMPLPEKTPTLPAPPPQAPVRTTSVRGASSTSTVHVSVKVELNSTKPFTITSSPCSGLELMQSLLVRSADSPWRMRTSLSPLTSRSSSTNKVNHIESELDPKKTLFLSFRSPSQEHRA